MQIKIVKASKNTYWYADKIGEVFDVSGSDNTDWSVDVEGADWLVSKEDAEIVNENNDKLGLLESYLSFSNGCITIYWDIFEKKIKYQILIDDSDVELEDIKDVYKILEAQSVIERYKKR